MEFSCYGMSLTGSTDINGDVFYISPEKNVFLLADGASGAGERGKVLMGKICVEVLKEFDYKESKLEPKSYIEILFQKINRRLIELSIQNKNLLYGTIILAVLEKNILTVTTFGDSPAYFCSKDSVKQIARNKKRYENMIDQGYITREEYQGYIDSMHFMMKSCFDLYLPQILPNNIIEQFIVSSGDMFLMCSDGLGDFIEPQTIFGLISQIGQRTALEKIIEQAKEKALKFVGYVDDITAIILSWK